MTNIKRIMPLFITALLTCSSVSLVWADVRAGRIAYSNDDYETAQFQLAAEDGNMDAQMRLGNMYLNGEGAPQDYSKAAYWFDRAARQGAAVAQFALGAMYADGEGVPQDSSKAAYWTRAAAEQGFAPAQFNLGLFYRNGDGVPQDYPEAVYWFHEAAEQGDPDAQFRLALMHYNGHGITRDYREAAKWFRLAAEQNRVEAQYNLGIMYQFGEGVPQDYEQALRWYRMAAEQGDEDAQLNLGLMYGYGYGVMQDYVQAHMWSNLAAARGNKSARENRDGIAQRMTFAQIGEAQRLAREWRPTTYAETSNYVWPPERASVDESAASPELVREVQELLTNLGYDPGPADGVSGPTTTTAIRAYQSANDLAVTGVVSDALRDDLREHYAHIAAIENAHPNVWKILDSGQLNKWIEQQPSEVATELRRIQESGTTEEVIAMLDRFKAESTDPERLELTASGSGFIVSDDGDVLTNHHVVEDCREVRIAPSEVALSMIGNDPENDLALLRGVAQTKGIASFPATAAALRGDSVVVAGFPLPGLLSSEMGITTGNVSALSGPGGDSRLMQITAPIQPGNSGGPVLDEKGQVVGVVVAEIDSVLVANTIGYIPQNVNFAIKTAVARNFLDTYEVAYQTGPPGEILKTSVIAERAEDFTVAIGCWK